MGGGNMGDHPSNPLPRKQMSVLTREEVRACTDPVILWQRIDWRSAALRGMQKLLAEERGHRCRAERERDALLACLIHLAERDWFKDETQGVVSCSLDAAKVRDAVLLVISQNVQCASAGAVGSADEA